MESLGVISKVTEPTPWCAGMVVVPKKSGAMRICVDLKPLNDSVLREVHPIPGVEEALAKLSGSTVFSKLDANSGLNLANTFVARISFAHNLHYTIQTFLFQQTSFWYFKCSRDLSKKDEHHS